jgi:hypothetical protein
MCKPISLETRRELSTAIADRYRTADRSSKKAIKVSGYHLQLLGLDTDNDSAFMNDTLWDYCQQRKLELTRSRAYRKNDQA